MAIRSYMTEPLDELDILGDQEENRLSNYQFADDTGAYDEALRTAEERRALDESRGIERTLGDLQGRGLARSGIALTDIINRVLGPSLLRGQEMASQFGLDRLNAKRNQDMTRYGSLRDLFSSRFGAAQSERDLRLGSALEDQRRQREGMEERRRRRRGGLSGLLGGGVGALLTKSPAGATAGYEIGSGLGF